MKNMLLDHLETTLKFSYPLCTMITEYETLPVNEVEVQCTLLYSGELMIEYRLRIDGIDSIALPVYLFDDDLVRGGNYRSLGEIERMIRERIQVRIPDETLSPAPIQLDTVSAYAIAKEVAKHDDVRIVTFGKSSEENTYQYSMTIYVEGIDLGGVCTSIAPLSSLSLLELREKDAQMVETLVEQFSFVTLVEMFCSCKNDS